VDQRYTSSELWHFVGRAAPDDDDRNYATLKAILAAGCVSHPPHNRGQGTTGYSYNIKGTFREGSLIVPTVTCYADIPTSALGVHVKKYGRFGVAFRRSFLVHNFARPVTYVPIRDADGPLARSGAYTLQDIEAVFRGLQKALERTPDVVKTRSMTQVPETDAELLRAMKYVFELELLSFIKAFHADLADDDPNNYYMEREWRKFGNLLFELKDVADVCVAERYATTIVADFPELQGRVRLIPKGQKQSDK
jgi:hypothetical protein